MPTWWQTALMIHVLIAAAKLSPHTVNLSYTTMLLGLCMQRQMPLVCLPCTDVATLPNIIAFLQFAPSCMC